MKSLIVGRVVDGYTNILTVKLFARLAHEDRHVRDVFEGHTTAYRSQMRLLSTLFMSLQAMNALMLVGETALAVAAWQAGRVDVGTVAMAIPLTWQIASAAGWVAVQVTDIFENLGTIQEGMMTIARPIALQDRAGAGELAVTRGEIRFEAIRFGYGKRGRADRGPRPAHPRRREGGARRPLGRRQDHAGQPAAALPRARRRPHPGRRAGRRRP